MNGYGSQRSPTATALTAIQMMTMKVWPRMYWGVPKKRAAASARRPNASSPKALEGIGHVGRKFAWTGAGHFVPEPPRGPL